MLNPKKDLLGLPPHDLEAALAAHFAVRGSVLRMVLAEGGKLVLFGSAIGLAIGFLLSRVTASLVVGVGPNDPVTFIGVPLVLLVTALLANFIPAYRATRIDPMEALRTE